MKIKKLTAYLMSLVMLLGAASVQMTIALAEGEKDRPLMDMNLVRKMGALGILDEDPDADYSREVTRAELAKIVVRFIGYEQILGVETENRPFLDVLPYHPAAKEIQLLYRLGFISGNGSRMFEPDRAATCSEAAAMLLNAMGYRGFAVSMGDFEQGYLLLAKQNDMLDGITLTGGDALTLRDIYIMLDNSLDMPICVQTGFGEDMQYVIKKESTPLKEYHRISRAVGMVTGNELTRLSEPEALDSDEKIEINHEVFDTPGNQFGTLLGLTVEYYVKEDRNGESIVVYVEERKNQNRSVEIAAQDIISADSNSIQYWDYNGTGKRKSLSVSPSVYVIYNGRTFTGYGTLDKVMPANGKIVCLSNNGGNAVDVLLITDYQNIVVGGVDKEEEIVYDRDSNQGYYLNRIDCDVKLYGPNGKNIRLAQLKEWDVITLMESRNKTGRLLKSGYVTRTTVSGQITRRNTEGNRIKLAIDGQEYFCADSLSKTLSIGMNGTYYLNSEGEVVAFQASDVSGTMYAILVAKAVDSSLFGSVKLKLFTQDGIMKEYAMTDKVEIDGQQYRTDAIVASGGDLLPVTGSLIRYRLKEEEKVSFIDSGSNGNEGNLRLICTGSNIKVRANMVSGKAVISDNTIIFGMPKTFPAQDDEFSILTPKTFTAGTSYGNTEYGAYNLGNSEIGMATAMYVKGMKSGSQAAGSAFGIVTDIADAIDDDGAPVKMLYMIRGGTMLELPVKEKTLLDGKETENGRTAGIQVGDVVRVGTDAAGMIYEIVTIFNADGSPEDGASLSVGGTVDTNAGTFDAEYRAVYGTVESLEGNYMKFSTGEEPDKNYGVCSIANTSIVKYYSDNETADSIDKADIIRGDKFVMRLNLGSAREIIVLK